MGWTAHELCLFLEGGDFVNFVEWLVERLDFRLHQAANVPSTPVPTVTSAPWWNVVYTQGKGAAGGEKGKGQPAEAAGGEKGKGKPLGLDSPM